MNHHVVLAGSYISGHAVILRRSPSVWVDMQLKPSIDAVDIENPQGGENSS